MDPKGLNLRVTRLGEEVEAMRVRLDVISLRNMMESFKPELWKEEANEIKFEEAKFLWKIGQVILIKCYGEYGSRAIRLLRALTYFDNVAIDLTIFPRNKFESLVVLKTSGLVRMVKIKYTALNGVETEVKGIAVHSRMFGQMILEENQREEIEEDLIGDCLLILRHTPRQVNQGKRDRYFPGIWTKASDGNYVNLMKEFKQEALRFCQTHYNRRPLQFTEFISKTMEGLRSICTGEDNKVFRLQCIEIELSLPAPENAELTEFKLAGWKEYFTDLEEFIQNNPRTNITDLRIEKLAIMTKNLSDTTFQSQNSENLLKEKFLEECIRGHKFVFDYHRAATNQIAFPHSGPFRVANNLSGIFKCSTLLGKTGPILETLRHMFAILNEFPDNEIQIHDNNFGRGDPTWWVSVFEDVVECCGHGHFPQEEENEILTELSLIFKHVNQSVYNSLHPRYSMTHSRFTKAYMICLVMLKDFEHIVQMVKTVNERWKRKCESLIEHDFEQSRMAGFVQNFFDWQESMVFKNAADADPENKEKLIKDSIATSTSVLSIVLGIGRNCVTHYNYSSVGPLYLIKCFMELGHMKELIEFSSEFEVYIQKKFEEDPQGLANEWVKFLECQIGFISQGDAIVNVREKSKYFPLLQTIGVSTQRLWLCLEIHRMLESNQTKSDLMVRVENIVQFCNSFKN